MAAEIADSNFQLRKKNNKSNTTLPLFFQLIKMYSKAVAPPNPLLDTLISVVGDAKNPVTKKSFSFVSLTREATTSPFLEQPHEDFPCVMAKTLIDTFWVIPEIEPQLFR